MFVPYIITQVGSREWNRFGGLQQLSNAVDKRGAAVLDSLHGFGWSEFFYHVVHIGMELEKANAVSGLGLGRLKNIGILYKKYRNSHHAK